MTIECTREHDLIEAIAACRWPERVDAELRAHAASCGRCADLVAVATALRADCERAWQEARVPPSGVVWWRAQLRAREDAARAAARPLAFIQGVAVSVALWLVVALLRTIGAADLAPWRGWSADVLRATFAIPDLASGLRLGGIIPVTVLCLLLAWLMLAPIAIYFAVADE